MPADPTVVDATIIYRFAAAERMVHLPAAVGGTAAVCRTVWEPDESFCQEGFKSEVGRTSELCQRRQETRRSLLDRGGEERLADQLAAIDGLHSRGDLVVIDLDDGEQELFAQLASADHAPRFGLVFPLAPSAAASVAVAAERDWDLASDDTDAARAFKTHCGRHPIGSDVLLDACARPPAPMADFCKTESERAIGAWRHGKAGHGDGLASSRRN